MTMVNRLKAAAVFLGVVTAVTSRFLFRCEPTGGKPTVGGFNPGGVTLSEDLMSNRFARQPVVTYETKGGDTLFAVQVKPAPTPAGVSVRARTSSSSSIHPPARLASIRPPHGS